MTSEQILIHYPEIYNLAGARDNILNTYRQQAYAAIRRRSGHGDPTLGKTLRLLQLADAAAAISATGRWIEEELHPADRPLLLQVWRGLGWSTIARRGGVTVSATITTWTSMITNLTTYINQCAGHACAPVGDVFVRSLNKYPRARLYQKE